MTGRRGGLLRQRNFRLFWAGESISEVGNSVTIVVIPLVAIDTLHTSPFIVTLLTAMVWLPWVIIGIPAGAWVDRLPPRPVMLASDAISVAVYASVPVAAWCGVLTVAQLIAVTLIAGAATVFFNSAYQVLLPGVLDEARSPQHPPHTAAGRRGRRRPSTSIRGEAPSRHPGYPSPWASASMAAVRTAGSSLRPT
jgi:MFS family permease